MPANRIERDYDKVLGNFRRDFSSQKGESIRKMRDSVRNIADISVKRDASTTSLNSIASNGSDESRRNSLSDMKTHGMCVSFSELSPAEARDLRAWNMRLDREEVFNQSYKPMQEELKELKSIEKDLVLKRNDLGGLVCFIYVFLFDFYPE